MYDQVNEWSKSLYGTTARDQVTYPGNIVVDYQGTIVAHRVGKSCRGSWFTCRYLDSGGTEAYFLVYRKMFLPAREDCEYYSEEARR